MTTATGFAGTSTTSLTIATGTQTLTTQTGLSFTNGNLCQIQGGAPYQWMIGTVTSYNSGSGSLVCNIAETNGSGTGTSWSL